MRAEYDLYVRRNSWLHQIDPRAKLLFVVVATFYVFAWPTPLVAATIAVLCTAILLGARIPAGQIGRIWRMMAPLMILVFILTAVFGAGSGPAWLNLGPLVVTASSVRMGAMLALRLLALAMVVFLLLFTTDQATLVKAFLALHLPYEWGLTLALALRYLPIFAGMFVQVREAQQARGLDLEQRRFFQRLRAYQPVLVAMVISALRQSEHLGWALEVRALGASGVQRSVFRPLRLRPRDVIVLVALGAILALGILARVG
jgi:energy-coupling factor transport system permease protein